MGVLVCAMWGHQTFTLMRLSMFASKCIFRGYRVRVWVGEQRKIKALFKPLMANLDFTHLQGLYEPYP